MALESIEKLRELASTEMAWMELAPSDLERIADEIEREIAERYMELPVDADGVPIHMGDELYLSELTHGEVSALMLTPDGWEWELEGDGWYDVGFTYRVKPDPVKELLEELIGRAYAVEKVDSAPHPVVDESDIDEIAARIWEVAQKSLGAEGFVPEHR